jgi:uncharacterized membrane protein
MRAWKGLVFMWGTVGLIALVELVTTYPVVVGAWIHTNPQIFAAILSACITLPLMIWLIKFMTSSMGQGSKKPDHWWTDDEKDEF